jgi:hypothetical protein
MIRIYVYFWGDRRGPFMHSAFTPTLQLITTKIVSIVCVYVQRANCMELRGILNQLLRAYDMPLVGFNITVGPDGFTTPIVQYIKHINR